MPFQQITPRPLNRRGIETYAPSASGVYGISNARQWLFIGESDDIRSTLQGRAQEWAAVSMEAAVGFVYELCDPANRRSRVDRLVQEYEPTGNRRVSRSSR